MKIKATTDKELAAAIRAGLKKTGGYCPCVNPEFYSEDTKCVCKNFREAPVGATCHCGLYIKIED